jgi:hypothetical protein
LKNSAAICSSEKTINWRSWNIRNNVLYLPSIWFCCNLSMVFLKLSFQNFVWGTFNVYADTILPFFDHHLTPSGHFKPWMLLWTLPCEAEGNRIIEEFQSRNRSESHSYKQPAFFFQFLNKNVTIESLNAGIKMQMR